MKESNKVDARPSTQWYPGDYLEDEALKLCSLAAQGLWMRMLCRMWFSPTRGVLLRPNGLQADEGHIGVWEGVALKEVQGLLRELETEEVFSRREEDGAVYSRRMVRDEKIRQLRAESGAKGGKQTGSKTPSEPKAKPQAKPKQTGKQNGSSRARASSSSPSSSKKEEGPPFQFFLFTWNRMASKAALPLIKEVTKERRRIIRSRWTNRRWRDEWEAACAKIPDRRFLLGDNDRCWRADFDWFLQPDSVTKILEGKYADGISKAKRSPGDYTPLSQAGKCSKCNVPLGETSMIIEGMCKPCYLKSGEEGGRDELVRTGGEAGGAGTGAGRDRGDRQSDAKTASRGAAQRR